MSGWWRGLVAHLERLLPGDAPRGGRALGVCIALAGCGGASKPAPPAPAGRPPLEAKALAGVSASAEVGGLNEREAEESFRASLDGLQACVASGMERLEFIAGSIEFAVEVDASRRAKRVWAAESTLGERSTEKCMLEALRAVSWPAPEGGAVGIARSSFVLEPRKGAPAPNVWDAGRVAGTLRGVEATLSECGGEALGQLHVTLHIGKRGQALAAGAASARPVDDAEIDCVLDALLAARYPRPERAPAIVRFSL